MEKWKPDLPSPASENWRMAYGAVPDTKNKYVYNRSETPAITSYQAPQKEPVPFVYDSIKLSGGLSVDTAEYPFFGLWSSTPLNEKPQGITVSGFLRGNEYIKIRNALVEALRVITTDDEPGFLTLPLWGRFPVIVTEWDIEESAKELGQCKISITFTRAGCPVEKRWTLEGEFGKTISEAAEAVKDAACVVYDKKLKGNLNIESLIASFPLLQKSIIDITGRIQGAKSMLNAITNSAAQMSNLLAQGIRSPKILALALFAAIGKMTASLASIKNAEEETIAFFRIRNNEKNAAFCFLANNSYTLPINAITIKQVATKTATEQLYKTASLYAAASLLPAIENATYNTMKNMFLLYDRLEKAIDLNEPELYFAVSELRSSVSRALAQKELSQELSVHLNAAVPLLPLAQYLGSEEQVLRELNRIEDSFVIQGDIRYV